MTNEFNHRHKLILASASGRRVTLLAQLGVKPDLIDPANIDEVRVNRESPRAMVIRLAKMKAKAVAERHPPAFVLAADTLVCVGTRILGKPENEREAKVSLKLISGRSHKVLSGVALVTPCDRLVTRFAITSVRFKHLSPQELDNYIKSSEWSGKAGGYAIQGYAAAFVRHISGSYSNIVGLPLFETSALLLGNGFSSGQYQ